MNLSVTITGFERVELKLKYMQRALEAGLTDIAAAGGFVIENEAKMLAPVKTGNLRRSIHTEWSATPTRGEARVGPSVDYAPYLEFGTRYMHPRPFLRPAFQNKKQEAYNEMKAMAKETIHEWIASERSR